MVSFDTQLFGGVPFGGALSGTRGLRSRTKSQHDPLPFPPHPQTGKHSWVCFGRLECNNRMPAPDNLMNITRFSAVFYNVLLTVEIIVAFLFDKMFDTKDRHCYEKFVEKNRTRALPLGIANMSHRASKTCEHDKTMCGGSWRHTGLTVRDKKANTTSLNWHPLSDRSLASVDAIMARPGRGDARASRKRRRDGRRHLGSALLVRERRISRHRHCSHFPPPPPHHHPTPPPPSTTTTPSPPRRPKI